MRKKNNNTITMADKLLKRIEDVIGQTNDNIVNIPLGMSEREYAPEVQKRLEEGYHYECEVKRFIDWQNGVYTILAVHLDGATRLVIPDAPPMVKDGQIGT